MSDVQTDFFTSDFCSRNFERVSGDRTIRVLTLTPFYPSEKSPAEGCFVAEPLNWTARFGIANEVIAVRPFYRGKVRFANGGTKSVGQNYFSIPGNLGLATAGKFLTLGLIKKLRKANNTRVFDLIHAHGALPCGHAAAQVSRELGIPFVITVHGLDVFAERQVGRALSKLCGRQSRRVYREARAVLCISERVREQICSGMKANTRVVYNGVDPGMFYTAHQFGCPGLVLSVGNLIPTKGHELLLRAFAHVQRNAPECRLEIIGDGPERVSLIRLAAHLGISDHVFFRGRQDRSAVAEAMRRCAVFALPSSYEGLGCVYLEAMASAKPVIGCRGQGIEEVIDHGMNGLLIKPGDEDDLTGALQICLQNEEYRRRIGAAARNTILQRYTLEHQAAELTEIYRKCVS